jgi:hypothetical protein
MPRRGEEPKQSPRLTAEMLSAALGNSGRKVSRSLVPSESGGSSTGVFLETILGPRPDAVAVLEPGAPYVEKPGGVVEHSKRLVAEREERRHQRQRQAELELALVQLNCISVEKASKEREKYTTAYLPKRDPSLRAVKAARDWIRLQGQETDQKMAATRQLVRIEEKRMHRALMAANEGTQSLSSYDLALSSTQRSSSAPLLQASPWDSTTRVNKSSAVRLLYPGEAPPAEVPGVNEVLETIQTKGVYAANPTNALTQTVCAAHLYGKAFERSRRLQEVAPVLSRVVLPTATASTAWLYDPNIADKYKQEEAEIRARMKKREEEWAKEREAALAYGLKDTKGASTLNSTTVKPKPQPQNHDETIRSEQSNKAPHSRSGTKQSQRNGGKPKKVTDEGSKSEQRAPRQAEADDSGNAEGAKEEPVAKEDRQPANESPKKGNPSLEAASSRPDAASEQQHVGDAAESAGPEPSESPTLPIADEEKHRKKKGGKKSSRAKSEDLVDASPPAPNEAVATTAMDDNQGPTAATSSNSHEIANEESTPAKKEKKKKKTHKSKKKNSDAQLEEDDQAPGEEAQPMPEEDKKSPSPSPQDEVPASSPERKEDQDPLPTEVSPSSRNEDIHREEAPTTHANEDHRVEEPQQGEVQLSPSRVPQEEVDESPVTHEEKHSEEPQDEAALAAGINPDDLEDSGESDEYGEDGFEEQSPPREGQAQADSAESAPEATEEALASLLVAALRAKNKGKPAAGEIPVLPPPAELMEGAPGTAGAAEGGVSGDESAGPPSSSFPANLGDYFDRPAYPERPTSHRRGRTRSQQGTTSRPSSRASADHHIESSRFERSISPPPAATIQRPGGRPRGSLEDETTDVSDRQEEPTKRRGKRRSKDEDEKRRRRKHEVEAQRSPSAMESFGMMSSDSAGVDWGTSAEGKVETVGDEGFIQIPTGPDGGDGAEGEDLEEDVFGNVSLRSKKGKGKKGKKEKEKKKRRSTFDDDL